MKLIKDYLCEGRTPSDDEIKQGIEIANSEDCIVHLIWVHPYSGKYELYISKGTAFEECKDKLPKRYPV